MANRIGIMRPRRDGGYSLCYASEDQVGKGRCVHLADDSHSYLESYSIVKDSSNEDLVPPTRDFHDNFEKTMTKASNRKDMDIVKANDNIMTYMKANLSSYIKKDISSSDPLSIIKLKSDKEFDKLSSPTLDMSQVMSYTDGKYCYLRNTYRYKQREAIKTYMNFLSTNTYKDRKTGKMITRSGIDDDTHQSRALNNCLTNYFVHEAIDDKDQLINGDWQVGKAMVAIFGAAKIKEAYFQNKPQLLRDAWEEKLGQNSWNNLARAMETAGSSLSDPKDRRDALAYAYACMQYISEGKNNDEY